MKIVIDIPDEVIKWFKGKGFIPIGQYLTVDEAMKKAEPLSEILDKISAEIREAREDLDGYDPNALITFADRVDDIIEKYREPKGEKGTGCTSTHNVMKR